MKHRSAKTESSALGDSLWFSGSHSFFLHWGWKYVGISVSSKALALKQMPEASLWLSLDTEEYLKTEPCIRRDQGNACLLQWFSKYLNLTLHEQYSLHQTDT